MAQRRVVVAVVLAVTLLWAAAWPQVYPILEGSALYVYGVVSATGAVDFDSTLNVDGAAGLHGAVTLGDSVTQTIAAGTFDTWDWNSKAKGTVVGTQYAFNFDMAQSTSQPEKYIGACTSVGTGCALVLDDDGTLSLSPKNTSAWTFSNTMEEVSTLGPTGGYSYSTGVMLWDGVIARFDDSVVVGDQDPTVYFNSTYTQSLGWNGSAYTLTDDLIVSAASVTVGTGADANVTICVNDDDTDACITWDSTNEKWVF